MGKKRRMFKAPQKFGRKFNTHPRMKHLLEESEIVIEEPNYEPIISAYEEEKPQVKLEEKPIKKVTPAKTKVVAKKKRTAHSKPKRTAKITSKK